MEAYQTEEQQVEAIKSFWSENGSYIIGGLVLGFASFIGFNYYKDSKLEQEVAVATKYQAIIESKTSDSEDFKTQADGFIQSNAESSYVSLTALNLAKDAAEQKDWEKASTHLATAIKAAPNEGIKAIATVRLARVQIQIADYDNALATIGTTLPEAFNVEIQEIKGDIYLKQGKKSLARDAYQAAIDSDGLAKNPSLQIKLDDLAQAIVLPK